MLDRSTVGGHYAARLEATATCGGGLADLGSRERTRVYSCVQRERLGRPLLQGLYDRKGVWKYLHPGDGHVQPTARMCM